MPGIPCDPVGPVSPLSPFAPVAPFIAPIRTVVHDAGDVAGGITTPVRIHKYSVVLQAGGVLAHPLVGATVEDVDFANSCTGYCPS